jgi:peroxiredoxin (alkyl hydroperoxide reductase subunit C)
VSDQIQVGQPAPDFTLRDEQNQEVKLSDLRGQKVVLMFYPLDFSPICEGEFCEMRDRWSDWEGTGATVFGISRDSVWAHKAWKEQQGFKHRLLADMNGAVARLFGAWNEERGIANRRTVVIDKDGVITAIDQTANPGVARDQGELMVAATQAG